MILFFNKLTPSEQLHNDQNEIVFKKTANNKKSRTIKIKKNENLIRIIRENCEKRKVQPCDAFVIPLLALSDYYTSENFKNLNSLNNNETNNNNNNNTKEKAMKKSSDMNLSAGSTGNLFYFIF